MVAKSTRAFTALALMGAALTAGCGPEQQAETTTIPAKLPSGPGGSGGSGTAQVKMKVGKETTRVNVTPNQSAEAEQTAAIAARFGQQYMNYITSGTPPSKWDNTSPYLRKALSKDLKSRPKSIQAQIAQIFQLPNVRPVALNIESPYRIPGGDLDTPFKLFYTDKKSRVTDVVSGIIKQKPGGAPQVVTINNIGYQPEGH